MDERLLELETMVVEAWPAAETEHLDGWLLRASGGPTHRGNSIATLGANGSASLDERIDRAERWYHARGRTAMFQVGPCASPPGLDAALAARGYVIEGAACFAAAPASHVVERTARERSRWGGSAVRVESSPGQGWIDVNARASRFAATFEVFLGFVARLGARCRFVSVRAPSDEVAASALGIISGARLGVYAMLTAPEFRRQGAARAALHALARAALLGGSSEVYLLFDRSNAAAAALYGQSGFTELYDYHYRSKASASER